MSYIEEALTAHYGERCEEFHPECHLCRAWAEYDALSNAPIFEVGRIYRTLNGNMAELLAIENGKMWFSVNNSRLSSEISAELIVCEWRPF